MLVNWHWPLVVILLHKNAQPPADASYIMDAAGNRTPELSEEWKAKKEAKDNCSTCSVTVACGPDSVASVSTVAVSDAWGILCEVPHVSQECLRCLRDSGGDSRHGTREGLHRGGTKSDFILKHHIYKL